MFDDKRKKDFLLTLDRINLFPKRGCSSRGFVLKYLPTFPLFHSSIFQKWYFIS